MFGITPGYPSCAYSIPPGTPGVGLNFAVAGEIRTRIKLVTLVRHPSDVDILGRDRQ